MSDPPMQFETAEYDAPPPCAVCGAAIVGVHYRVGDGAICARCRVLIEQHEAAASSPEALGRAAGYGLAAAAGGTLAWLQLREVAGDFRIAAIGVAWLVAWAVRRAAGGGGRVQQALAVAFTGGSIAVYLATGPRWAWADSTSAVLWALVGGIALFSAWQRTGGARVPFGEPLTYFPSDGAPPPRNEPEPEE
jgi:hypothetical protein